ncbi:FMN-dependent NADH-azoreductase [Marinibactrum halimedae]|uniref:FMN dependent NADH:quinone oxidoreductase n=1 Tax=Marinibactrum halimedae TaxID=1444977 RepID=A0AA37WN78_9GAMM|nr:NAD(P)H-dependent oxidoreductase [Marinibactrum halimedae]MCD9459096.1 NAD(P)H-dependent oxidoreductase [Marinibactrum halimedae]GLS24697.1 FMN-dependent NADH-azoreductase [Marinibactrum halimedae]
MNLLVVKSSVFGQGGQSSGLAETFCQQWKARYPDADVVERDVVANPIPHLDGERIGALFSDPETRSSEQQSVVDFADDLLEELTRADAIVLAVPMYNFSIPSQLKAWMDHLARAGVSFKYTENGPVGLLKDKPIYVLAARGGVYQSSGQDYQAPLLKQFFGLLGFESLRFVYAEGLNLGEESKASALNDATQHIANLVAAFELGDA